MARQANYSDYLNRVSALCGIDSSTLNSQEEQAFNGWFNKNAKIIWEAYFWPAICLSESRTPDADLVIAYEQSGQDVIDTVIDVFATDPTSTALPRRLGWTLTSEGIQLIGPTTASAVYVLYRKPIPDFSGNDYSGSSSYAVGDQVYYTDTSTNKGNYYECLSVTSPGQSPNTHPAKWELIELPFDFLDYIIYASYADWLLNDGQNDKSAQAEARAEMIMFNQVDKLCRQQRFTPPMTVYSHLTSRPLY